MCNVKLNILTILSVQFNGTKYIHTVVQPPPPISRTFSHSHTESQHRLNSTSPSSHHSALQNHHSTFCHYEPDYSRYLK